VFVFLGFGETHKHVIKYAHYKMRVELDKSRKEFAHSWPPKKSRRKTGTTKGRQWSSHFIKVFATVSRSSVFVGVSTGFHNFLPA